MSITLGATTKLLDNMMEIFSEWHTERAPQGNRSVEGPVRAGRLHRAP
jgi:hypothetical protein